jgi:polar amino acid transport system substrate-binding protein
LKKHILLFIFLFVSLSANEKIILQLKWLHQFQFAGYYTALEKGYYKDAGLDVEIRERDLNKDNVQQVIDGEADYGVADSGLFLYIAKREPVVVVAPIFQHSPNILLTLKSSGIDGPYALEDKDLTFYKKDVDGFGIFAMLKSLNVEPIMSRFKDKRSYMDLANKKTDAYIGYLSNEPFYFKEMGIEVNIINPANYGFDLYGDMLFTSTKEAKKHPQRVEKFKEATLKGWKYALEHKEEIVNLIKDKYAKDKSTEHLVFEADALEQMIQHKAIPLGTINKGRVQFILNAYEKYGFIKNTVPIDNYIFASLGGVKKGNALFTKKEQEYLKNRKVIKMCIDPDWMPLEKNLNGKHIGMSADYFSILKRYIDVPIELINTKSWEESLKYGKARKCDIFSLVMPTKERKKYLDFTEPYLSIPVVIVTNLDELFINDITKIVDKKVGVVKGYAFGEILKERYPNISFVYVNNVKDGLEKVKDGELFGFIDTLATTGYYIQKDYIGQLKIAGKFDENWELGVGVRNDEPILREIFNKVITRISPEQRQEILNKWISVSYEKGTNYALIFTWVGIVAFVFSVILIAVMYVNRKMRLEIKNRKLIEKRLEEISITDELTSLYNRRHFNEIFPRALNSAKREHTMICLAILDIDYFKQYNDTYGHIAGDEVLKNIAISMRNSMQRADDYCFRLGGEEFGVLFKGLDYDVAKGLIEKVRQNIEQLHIEHKSSSVNQYVTASFGLVVRDANSVESENELYKEADMLLYEAKKAGRNRVLLNTLL